MTKTFHQQFLVSALTACAALLLSRPSLTTADQAVNARVTSHLKSGTSIAKGISKSEQNTLVVSEVTSGNDQTNSVGTSDWTTAENSLLFPNLYGRIVHYDKLTPTCAAMLDHAVTGPELPDEYGGTVIHASFSPKLGATLDNAAQTCGFKEFNWLQQRIGAPARWISESNPLPLLDTSSSEFPFYYDANYMKGQFTGHRIKTDNSLNFYDQPHHPDFRLGEFVEYQTVLVGVEPESSAKNPVFRPLYVFTWKSNWTGPVNDVVTCSAKTGAQICMPGTGGVFDIKVWSLQDTTPSATLSSINSRSVAYSGMSV